MNEMNKDTFEPDPMVFAVKEDSTSKDTWGKSYSSFEAHCDALHFLEHRRFSLLCTHPQCRGQET